MSIIIPENIIQSTVDNTLTFIKADWDSAVDKTKTALYDMWFGVSHGDYNYYEQAQTVFLKTDADNRKINIRPFYPKDQQRFPIIVVNAPSQNTGGEDGIGFDENKYGAHYNDDDFEYTNTFSRSFTGTYAINIFSDNKEEVQLIYYTIQVFMELLKVHLSGSGLQNLKISGADLRTLPQGTHVVPVFTRAVLLNGHINQTIKDYFANSMVQNFTFSGTPIESSIEL